MKLTVELVPQTCWFSNVRSAVSPAQWDFIRKQVYSAAYDTCEICGGVGDKHPVECHEVWNYDDENHIQKLERMIALCPDCHSVKHFGFTSMYRDVDRAVDHFRKVNQMKKLKKVNAYFVEVFKVWTERSKFEWKLDISALTDYGIDITKIKKERPIDD